MTHPSQLSQRAASATATATMFSAAMLVLTPLAACGGGGGRGTNSGSSSDAYTGTVTVENQSSLEVCRLMLDTQDGGFAEDVQLGPGESTTIDVDSSTIRFFVTECGDQRSLYGHPMNWYGSAIGETEYLSELAYDRIVLYDPGSAPGSAGDHRAVELNPRSISDWIFFDGHQDAQMASGSFDAVSAQASRESWNESVEFTIPLTDWNIERHPISGIPVARNFQAAAFARWPDGHCTMQAFGFRQGHDGSSFSGSIVYNGASAQLPIPCAALEYAANNPASSGGGGGGSVSSAGGGGGCTNTCGSANDGECDDGGPGSLYSVCALGTDCADCGAR